MENLNESQEISLYEIYLLLIYNIKKIFIISVFIASIVIFYVYFFATPIYSSSADIMVQVETSVDITDQTFDYNVAFRLLDTVSELLEKEIVLNEAIRILSLNNINISMSELKNGLSTLSSQSSYFINIKFESERQEIIKEVVDAIIDGAMNITNIENAFPVLTDKIRRTSFASDPVYASPNKTLYSVIGIVLGGIIGVGLVFIQEFLSQTYKSKDEVEKALGINVIGVIPKIKMKGILYEEK